MSHRPQASVPATFLSRARLLREGLDRRGIEAAVRDGRLIRVRRGRYLLAGAPNDLVRAARLGGRIDCVSLLSLLGIHVLERHRLHVQIDHGASRLPRPLPDIVRHWRATRAHPDATTADLVEALARSCRCQSPRDAVATLDSAWHLGFVDEADLDDVFALLPRRYAVLRPLLDRRSESGPESLVRLILRTIGCHVDLQVEIHGVGRVDFVVDGWLIVECDSKAHHEGWDMQRSDRRRDLAAARRGYATVRLLAEDVLYRRGDVAAALRDIIETRLRPAATPRIRHRRAATAAAGA